MGSHGKKQKPDKSCSDTLSRLKTRERLRKIANKRSQESNNNHKEHPLLDQDIAHHVQSIPTTAILGAPPPEPKYVDATNDKYKHVVPDIITLDSSSEEGPETDEELSGAESNPHNCQNPSCTQHGAGDSDDKEDVTEPNGEMNNEDADAIARYIYSDDDHKEDPVDLWALRQHQAGNKDPKFLSSSRAERRSMMYKMSWPPKGDDQKPECSSWLPAHPGEKLLRSIGSKLLQCDTCGRWVYGVQCNHA